MFNTTGNEKLSKKTASEMAFDIQHALASSSKEMLF